MSSSPIACPFKGISPEDLPAAAGPLQSTPPPRRHTPLVRPPPLADKHPRLSTGFHARQSVGLRPSAMCALPIRPPAGYVHGTLVLWPLPHQEQPPAPLFPARPRENILSESGTTTKATVEITAARGEGASSEAAGPPYKPVFVALRSQRADSVSGPTWVLKLSTVIMVRKKTGQGDQRSSRYCRSYNHSRTTYNYAQTA